MNVPVKEAAVIFEKSPEWVRCGIKEGWLPIGVATKKGERTNYYISPKLLFEYTGVMYEKK